jgi:hypothetical protein
MAKVDPRLLREIARGGRESSRRGGSGGRRSGGTGGGTDADSANTGDAEQTVASVQAVITLRSGPDGLPLSPEATEASVQQAVERARSITALDAHKVKVYKNLQSFTVEADPEFVKTLIEDDIVDSASLNKP